MLSGYPHLRANQNQAPPVAVVSACVNLNAPLAFHLQSLLVCLSHISLKDSSSLVFSNVETPQRQRGKEEFK